jgi:hypothetical protein
MDTTDLEGQPAEQYIPLTQIERAYVAIAKFMVNHPLDSSFTEKDVQDTTKVPSKSLHEAMRTFSLWQILKCVKTPGEAYKYSIIPEMDERDVESIRLLSEGHVPEKWRSGTPVGQGGGPKTSYLVLRALASNEAKAFTIPDLAYALNRSDLSVRKVVDAGIKAELYEWMDDHGKALRRGRSPKYYFITPKGTRHYLRMIGSMSPREQDEFLSTGPRQMLALDGKGQFKDLDDEPTGLTPEQEEYILKHGCLPPVSDDDDIPM